MASSRSLIFLGLFSFLCTFSLRAQDQTLTEYFRYFKVEIKGFEKIDRSTINLLFSENIDFRLDAFCDANKEIMIAVNASYPKRVPEIIEEIKIQLASEIAERRIANIEALSIDEKVNFCQ